jgi:hypothetical protein
MMERYDGTVDAMNDTSSTPGTRDRRDKPQHQINRAQRTTVVTGVLCFVLILVVLQLWLLTATMNAYLGGDDGAVWPALGASAVCLALNLGLLQYLFRR